MAAHRIAALQIDLVGIAITTKLGLLIPSFAVAAPFNQLTFGKSVACPGGNCPLADYPAANHSEKLFSFA